MAFPKTKKYIPQGRGRAMLQAASLIPAIDELAWWTECFSAWSWAPKCRSQTRQTSQNQFSGLAQGLQTTDGAVRRGFLESMGHLQISHSE